MACILLRVWLPDRPGALGQVASRLGGLRGDVIGIDILERGGGRVIDELIVDFPGTVLADLIVREVCQVDGVDVEDLRTLGRTVPDPRVDALDDAAALAAAPTQETLLSELVLRAHVTFAADWAVVIDHDRSSIRAQAGRGVPPAPWLAAFALGVRGHPSMRSAVVAGDLVCVPMDHAPAAFMASRPSRPFREREQRQLVALVAIASTCRERVGSVTRGAAASAATRAGRRVAPTSPT